MNASAPSATPFESGELSGHGSLMKPGGIALTQRAIGLAGWKKGDHVADVGCGQGGTLALLEARGIAATGVDPVHTDSERVGLCGYNVLGCRAESMPFLDGCLDGILTECSFSLIAGKHAALGEFFRVLRPGGRLVIADLYARIPINEPAPLSCLEGLMDRNEIGTLIRQAGFEIQLWEDHSTALTELVGRVLFEYGTLDVLWGQDTETEKSAAANSWMMRHRPGYMLLVARKGS